MPWPRAIILALLLTSGLYLQSVTLVEANGSIRSYEKKVIEKYVIGLGTAPPSPTIGVTHFAAFVEDKEIGVKYMDAEIDFTAVFSGLSPQEIGPYQMTNNLMDPMYYEVDIPLNKEGIWLVTLVITVEQETLSPVVYEVVVIKQNPIVPILVVGTLLFFLGILTLSLRAWVKEYRKKRKTRNNK